MPNKDLDLEQVTNIEQIRRLKNSAILSGGLAEFEYNVKKDDKGVDMLQMNGAIQCNPDSPVYTVYFRSNIKAQKKDGTDNKTYINALDWAENAVSKVKAAEKGLDEYTMVHAVGSVNDLMYVGQDGEFHQGVTYNMSFFNDFDDYQGGFDIEGYIASMKDEVRGEEETPTGRSIIRLISRDPFGNTLDLNNLIADEQITNDLNEAGYEPGMTTTFSIDFVAARNEDSNNNKGGIGRVRTTTGSNYLEMHIVGATKPLDEDDEKAISKDVAKTLLREREARKTKTLDDGYKGKNSKGTKGVAKKSTATKNNTSAGVGKVREEKEGFEELEDDADFPF